MNFAVVVSQFNTRINEGVLAGALDFFKEKKIKIAKENIFSAPGAFEMPLIAQTLAKTKKYDGIICLGCVIKGDTAHFEFISLGATLGIQQAILNTGIPIAFGILTTYTLEQAFVRADNNANNKGREAAAACFETVQILRSLKKKRR